jgi:hypothetical protein
MDDGSMDRFRQQSRGGDSQGYGDWLTTRAVQAAGAPKTDERASKFPLLCKWPERRSLPNHHGRAPRLPREDPPMTLTPMVIACVVKMCFCQS